MRHRITSRVVAAAGAAFLPLLAAACASTPEPRVDPELIGEWRSIPRVLESIEFRSDGTAVSRLGRVGGEVEGRWSVTPDWRLSLDFEPIWRRPAPPSATGAWTEEWTFAYRVSGNTLSIFDPDGRTFDFVRLGAASPK